METKGNNDDIASSYFQTKYGNGDSNPSSSQGAASEVATNGTKSIGPSNGRTKNSVGSGGTQQKKSWRSASVGLRSSVERGSYRSNTATPDRETRASSATRGGPMFSYLSLVIFEKVNEPASYWIFFGRNTYITNKIMRLKKFQKAKFSRIRKA